MTPDPTRVPLSRRDLLKLSAGAAGVLAVPFKNYGPNLGYDWGGRVTAAWLDR